MKDSPMTDSHERLWARYRLIDPSAPEALPPAFHFCDNEADADLCAALVVAGKKRATASSVAELELQGVPHPQAGDFSLITDWSGRAVAVIRTTDVTPCRLGQVDAAFAAAEGEGDGSLEWWRQAHLAYYTRVLAGTDQTVDDDLIILCEQFECLLTAL